MWLRLLPKSTTTLPELCDEVLPAIVNELESAGYTVIGQPIKRTTDAGWDEYSAVIDPGPATLLVSAKWGNDLNVVLTGPRFRGDYTDDRDAALWDSLETLRQRLVAAYGLDSPPLSDPGEVTGEPGAPGTI
jgi:hypothetical protein